jgi:hypothetical protein
MKMAHQGKYGWYPCDLGTYHKLKAINLAFDQAVHKMKAWERWERKDPKNRVIRRKLKDSTGQVVGYGLAEPMPEPELCPVFCKKVVKKVNFDKASNYHKDGINRTFVELAESSVYADYRKARYPVASEAEVMPLDISEVRIDKLYLAIKNR